MSMTGSPGTSSGSGSYAAGATEQGGTKDLAKDQASQVKQSATEAASQVGSTSKEQAAQVAQEAKTQAKDLAGQATGQVSQQVGQQVNAGRDKIVFTLMSIGDEIEQLLNGGGAKESGMVSDFARQAQTRVNDFANMLENREPADILEDVRSFARRRPGAFLLGAALTGVIAGRVTRGAQAARKDESSSDYSQYAGGQGTSYQSQSSYSTGTLPVPSTTSTASNTDAGYAAPYTDPTIDLTDSSAHGVAAEGYREPTTGPLAPGGTTGTGYGDESYSAGTQRESGSQGWSS